MKTTYAIAPETGCWEWTGYVDRNGYARVYDATRPKGKRTEWAHRASYEHYKGPIPPRHEIDHTCQNTICINPEHLDAVTNVEHAARTMRRLGKDDLHARAAYLRAAGLTYREIAETLEYGSSTGAALAVKQAVAKGLIDADAVPPQAHLSADERDDIRDLYAMGVPQTELAAWYGVDSSCVSRICNRLDSRAARNRARASA